MARRKAPIVWFEIPVTDFDRAMSFYKTLFGWTFEDGGDDDRQYQIIDAGDDSINGGLALRPPDQAPSGSGPVFYVEVSDLELTIVRAQKLGATLARPVTFLSPEAGVVAAIRDLDGNVIGLWAAE